MVIKIRAPPRFARTYDTYTYVARPMYSDGGDEAFSRGRSVDRRRVINRAKYVAPEAETAREYERTDGVCDNNIPFNRIPILYINIRIYSMRVHLYT